MQRRSVISGSDEPNGQRFAIYLRTKLPSETIDYGYSVARKDRDLNPSYYVALAKDCGFEVVTLTEQKLARKDLLLGIETALNRPFLFTSPTRPGEDEKARKHPHPRVGIR
jgi:hypothetical protein